MRARYDPFKCRLATAILLEVFMYRTCISTTTTTIMFYKNHPLIIPQDDAHTTSKVVVKLEKRVVMARNKLSSARTENCLLKSTIDERRKDKALLLRIYHEIVRYTILMFIYNTIPEYFISYFIYFNLFWYIHFFNTLFLYTFFNPKYSRDATARRVVDSTMTLAHR